MRLWVVLFESGRIYAIYKSRFKAEKAVKELNSYFEKATIKEYKTED